MKEDLAALGFLRQSENSFYRDLRGPESLVVNKLYNGEYQVLYSYRDDDGQPKESYETFEFWENCLDYVKEFQEDFSR
jgi:hypothetical protein